MDSNEARGKRSGCQVAVVMDSESVKAMERIVNEYQVGKTELIRYAVQHLAAHLCGDPKREDVNEFAQFLKSQPKGASIGWRLCWELERADQARAQVAKESPKPTQKPSKSGRARTR